MIVMFMLAVSIPFAMGIDVRPGTEPAIVVSSQANGTINDTLTFDSTGDHVAYSLSLSR